MDETRLSLSVLKSPEAVLSLPNASDILPIAVSNDVAIVSVPLFTVSTSDLIESRSSLSSSLPTIITFSSAISYDFAFIWLFTFFLREYQTLRLRLIRGS